MKRNDNQYYNKWEFYNILSQISKSPYETLNLIEEYMHKYPKDYRGKTIYALNLATIRRLDEAWEILNSVEKSYQDNKISLSDNSKNQKIEYFILTTRLKILLYQCKYDEFLDYWYAYDDILKKYRTQEMKLAFYYVKHKVGELKFDINTEKNYLKRQFLLYDYNLLIDRIKNQENFEKEKHGYFYPEFQVEKTISEVLQVIMNQNAECVYCDYFEDLYVFKYDNCGKDSNGKELDYFSVITFHNTTDIISMCPFPYGQRYKYIDIGYLKEDEYNKVKKKSAIDKFNERYKNY